MSENGRRFGGDDSGSEGRSHRCSGDGARASRVSLGASSVASVGWCDALGTHEDASAGDASGHLDSLVGGGGILDGWVVVEKINLRARWRDSGQSSSVAGARAAARAIRAVDAEEEIGASRGRVLGGAGDDAPDGRSRRRRGAPPERRESHRDGRASARASFGGVRSSGVFNNVRARVASRVVGRLGRRGPEVDRVGRNARGTRRT